MAFTDTAARIVREPYTARGCTHESMTDEAIRAFVAAPWTAVPSCDHCGDFYPHEMVDPETGDNIIVLLDEPYGAGV
jgi:hypothetical protein